MNEKVSIIMGIYNCQETLADSIDSILNQSYENWELVMCDDGSTDATFMIACDYQNKEERIKVIKNHKNQGLAQTLNNCLEHCTGEFIMRHDGDDLMVKNRIEKQVNYMRQQTCDACGSGAYIFDGSGVWGIRQPEMKPTRDVMVLSVPFIHPTVMMKQNILREVGGYTVNPITKQRLEDYDLWLKFFEKGFILHNIQEPLIYFREDKNSYSRKSRKYRITETKARLDACERLEISFLKRILAFKPLLVMLIPKRLLRRYHIWNAVRNNN